MDFTPILLVEVISSVSTLLAGRGVRDMYIHSTQWEHLVGCTRSCDIWEATVHNVQLGLAPYASLKTMRGQ